MPNIPRQISFLFYLRLYRFDEAAEKLYETLGFNELPHVEVSLWWILFVQFTGLMPYMMELACILALAVQDFIDFAIIAAIVLCNGFLGFHEELKNIVLTVNTNL